MVYCSERHSEEKQMSRLKQAHLRVCGVIIATLNLFAPNIVQAQASGEDTHDDRLFPCMEDGLRSSDTGCQLLAKMNVSQFPDGPLFWCLNRFQTRQVAAAAMVQNSLV